MNIIQQLNFHTCFIYDMGSIIAYKIFSTQNITNYGNYNFEHVSVSFYLNRRLVL